MSIAAGFMLPHPPLIVREIGRGEEKKIQKTIDAYEEAARRISVYQPETVVILSPHQIMYADYFHISPGRSAKGDFGNFRAKEVKFEVSYDTAFAEELSLAANRRNLPAGTMGERDKKLDHGTMVPLYFVNRFLSDYKIVRIGLSGLSFTKHYELGECIKETAERLGRKTVVIASGDLSHRLKEDGPYGYQAEGPVYDERIMEVMGSGNFVELFDFSEQFCDKAGECGHRAFIIMAGAFDQTSTEALGIKPEDIGGCPVGSLGIPEFGTEFVIQMLLDTKPKQFSDLIRISGLGHGTDVWLGNAQTLIEEGKATISTAICCRDDIMIYLIHMGLDPALAFKIMENVRKGKGLSSAWEEEMAAHNVPDWYIWSCNKIKYMFPKAHAAAYVMMAWRIAYCKVYYPLAYYAAFFSIRASAFSYELMCRGREHLEGVLNEYKKRGKDQLSKKEQDSMRDMKIVQEMYARGFEFLPIDLYRSDAKQFQIIDGKILPSFCSIDGLGEKAAVSICEAAKQGRFLSKDDFKERAKVGKALADQLEDLGILGDIPESNQISLFDMMKV